MYQALILPTKILPRVIITYGACARGGGRRPGFEARNHEFARAVCRSRCRPSLGHCFLESQTVITSCGQLIGVGGVGPRRFSISRADFQCTNSNPGVEHEHARACVGDIQRKNDFDSALPAH